MLTMAFICMYFSISDALMFNIKSFSDQVDFY